MPDEPSYLQRLKGIARAEARSHIYFSAWADVTPSPDVRAVLRTVAAREGDHGMAFAKRVDELGFVVEERDDPNFANQMAIATSAELSDREKMDKLGFPSYFAQIDGGPDLFDSFFADHTIDIRTGELFGRFISEERDTIRLLCSCYNQLKAAEEATGPTDVSVRAIEAKVDALCGAVDELRRAVLARNGKGKAKVS
jgi:hypothetical protein